MQQFLLKIIIVTALLLLKFNVSTSIAQNSVNIDSLEQILENSLTQQQPDSVINSVLIHLFTYYENNEWGRAANIAKQGISLFKSSNFDYCRLWHDKLGYLYLSHDIYQLALNTYYEGFNIAKNAEEPLGTCYNNLARVYLAQNLNLNKAGKLYLQAIDEHKKISDKTEQLKQLAYSYNQLGIVYERKKDHEAALKYYQKAFKIRSEQGDNKGLVNSMYTIAYHYKTTLEYDSAIVILTRHLV